jgi:hypothetical protein
MEVSAVPQYPKKIVVIIVAVFVVNIATIIISNINLHPNAKKLIPKSDITHCSGYIGINS